MTIQFLKRENRRNGGDSACSPLQYFRFGAFSRRYCTHRLYDRGDLRTDRPLIIGGGGLDYWRQKLERVAGEKRAPLVAWGMGLNRHGAAENDQYAAFYDQFDLAGMRDFGHRFRYVPCVSALHPAFRAAPPPSTRVVVYEHAESPLAISELPKASNALSIERALSFLAQGEFVVTNTYHGAYWATLLGRKALVIPLEYSSRFYFFKHAPTLTSVENWKYDLGRAVAHPEALDECVTRNVDFANDVGQLLGLRLRRRH